MNKERAILINLARNPAEKRAAEESMSELEGLARTAGAEVVRKVFQHRATISPKFFIGSGKVEEVRKLQNELKTDLIILDHDLSPIQQRGLEGEFQTRVIDRTQLILDIFGQRAKSNEGKLQVELARLTYFLPRLTGKGTSLSRLGAGIRTRGPGEKKLEEDRRRIADRISKIKQDIERIANRRANQRQGRKESPVPTVSLVGYTNAGKSTLFNRLSQSKMFTSPQLFATLDPVLRRVSYPDGLHFLLSDTVGFIKKLPVELITAFKATLEEVREADCICHVIDCTSPISQSQEEAVERILEEIGVPDIPRLKVYNKIDLMAEKETLLEKNHSATAGPVYVSAETGEGIPCLKKRLREILFHDWKLFYLKIPRDKSEVLHSLPKWSHILKKRENGDSLEVKMMAKPERLLNYLPYLERGDENW